MSENSTLARPYAEAVFELAQSSGELDRWSEMLAFAAAVAGDESIRALDANPKVGRGQLEGLLLDICGERLDAHGRNMVRLLVENDRLAVLPGIAAHFESLKADAQSIVNATVTTAFELDDGQKATLAEALERKLGRKVELDTRVDSSLIGGVVVRAGDTVIDGTIRGRLRALATHLNA
jgi:F-type H+-transporting ATPase subunit delta